MSLLDYYEYLVYNRECLDMLFLLENVYEVESGSMNDYQYKTRHGNRPGVSPFPNLGSGHSDPANLA